MSVASVILNYKLTFPQARSTDTEFEKSKTNNLTSFWRRMHIACILVRRDIMLC